MYVKNQEENFLSKKELLEQNIIHPTILCMVVKSFKEISYIPKFQNSLIRS